MRLVAGQVYLVGGSGAFSRAKRPCHSRSVPLDLLVELRTSNPEASEAVPGLATLGEIQFLMIIHALTVSESTNLI